MPDRPIAPSMARPYFESPDHVDEATPKAGVSGRTLFIAIAIFALALGGGALQYFLKQSNAPSLSEALQAKCDEARSRHRHLLASFDGAPTINDHRFLIWDAPAAQRAAWSLDTGASLVMVNPDGTVREDADGPVIFTGGAIDDFVARAAASTAKSRRRRGADNMTLSAVHD